MLVSVLSSGAEQVLPASTVLPANTVLVLRNGRVLIGRANIVGSLYEITVGEQGQARVPVSDVEMACATLDEAYFRKRENVRADDLHGHFSLADWCLRNGLPSRAADQLLVVYCIAPKHPQLISTERRLVSMESPHASLTPVAPEVLTASDPDEVGAAPVLPEGAMGYFTQRIQPMLLNRCASNACHGQRSTQQFQLIRPTRGQPMSHRMTQRNLLQAMSFVDRTRPEQSRLLIAPGSPHGKQQAPVFSERDAVQYQQLVAWAKIVAGKGTIKEPALLTTPVYEAGTPPVPPPRNASQASFESKDAPTSKHQPPTASDASSSADAPGVPQEPGAFEPSATLQMPQRLPVAPETPADPLDPEAFNREFGEKKP
jgi:hypothetical protein